MRGFDLRRRAAIDPWLRLVGTAVVRGVLYDLGPFPGLVRGEGRVVGELYEMRDPALLLSRVDSIEDFRPRDRPGSHYLREPAPAHRPSAPAVWSWLYVYNRPLRGARWLPTGDYATYVRRQVMRPQMSGRVADR